MKRFYVFLIVLSMGLSPLIASVGLEVGTGVVVETTSGVYVEIDSALTETGTGYFKGIISSGSRTGMTTFAGMTLSSGMDGTIVRTTGSAYSGGHGEGTNLLRYYEVNNSGASAVTADMQIAYVSSGAYDEQNGLSGPYFIYRWASSAWLAYGDGSSSSPVSTSSVEIPTGDSDWIVSEGIRLAVKIFLEGPYDDVGDSMTTSLNPSYIPTTSPHTEDGRTASSVPDEVTDWVLVELRTTVDGSAVAYRSCFIKSDGMLIADNGTTEYIGIPIEPGDYWVVIKHRNHLSVETPATRTGLTWGTTPGTYDFTTANTQFKDNDAALLESGVYGMYAGDGNGSDIVTNADRDPIYANLNSSGYYDADTNCSGIVTNADKDPVYANLNKGSNVN